MTSADIGAWHGTSYHGARKCSAYLLNLLQVRDQLEATLTKLFVYSLILLFTSAWTKHLLSASSYQVHRHRHSYTGLGLEMVIREFSNTELNSFNFGSVMEAPIFL